MAQRQRRHFLLGNAARIVVNQDANLQATLTGNNGFVKTGGGTLTLTGDNTFTGGVTIREGTIAGGKINVFGTLSNPLTFDGPSATLRLTTTVNNAAREYSMQQSGTIDTNGHTLTHAGVISGTGGLVKAGPGTLILQGPANTFTGDTVIRDGTLELNGGAGADEIGDNSGATGAVRVESGALLGGTGTVGGATTIESGAIHSPGHSPGLQTFTAGLTYETGSTLVWELTLNGSAPALRGAPAGYDGIDLTGGTLHIALGADLRLAFDDPMSLVDWSDTFWATDQEWLIIDLSNTATLNPATALLDLAAISGDAQGDPLAGARPGASFATYFKGDDLYLQYMIPESHLWPQALLTAIALLLWARQRKIARARAR